MPQRKEICKNGHSYLEVGYTTTRKGARRCKECVRAWRRKYHKRQRKAINQRSRDWYIENQERVKEKSRKHRAENKEKIRFQSIERKYGMSKPSYLRMLKAQGGCCAICGGEPGGRYNIFNVDHDHNTGEIRGLLCNNCNLLIGLAKDNPDILQCAAVYQLGPGRESPLAQETLSE